MRVAIDVGPMRRGHKVRGVGVYVRNLTRELERLKAEGLKVVEFANGKIPKDVDLVHYPFFDLFFHTLPIVKRFPTVVTVHDVTPLVFSEHYPPGVRGKINFQLQKLGLGSVRAVITDSDCSRKDIGKYLRVPLSKIYRVYLAGQPEVGGEVLEAELDRVKRKYGLPERFVLYVGDVNWNKNLLSLAEAVGAIRIQNPESEVKLVIVGKQAGEKEFDRRHIENRPLLKFQGKYGNDPGVLRLGYVPGKELAAIYKLATVYCQPSFYEGFGVSVVEAMSVGCPVVSTKGGSLPEVGGEAVVYAGPTSESLVRGISLVLGLTKAQRTRLVQEGKKQAGKFSWGKVAEETYEVYRRALEKR